MLPIVVLDTNGDKLFLHSVGAGPVLDADDVHITFGKDNLHLASLRNDRRRQNGLVSAPPIQPLRTSLSQRGIGQTRGVEGDVFVRYEDQAKTWHETRQHLMMEDDLIVEYERIRAFSKKELACK